MGGTERVAGRLHHLLQKRGWDSQAVYPRDENAARFLDWLRAQGVEARTDTAVQGAASGHGWKTTLEFARFVRRQRPDVVNIHYGDNFLSLKDVIGVRLAGVRRCIATLHQAREWDDTREQKRVNTGRAARLCERIVLITEAARPILHAAGVEDRKLTRIHCGFTPPETHLEQREARAALSLPDADFVVATVARLVPQKGVADLIRAFARVFGTAEAAENRALLLVVGDGEQRIELERLAAEWMPGRVVFTGHVSGPMSSVYAAADVVALASYHEGIPALYLEAGFLGIPSIGTNVGGTSEAILADKSGILIPPGDGNRLAEALGRLYHSPLLRQTMGAAARQNALAHWTEERMAEEYERLFRER